MAYNKKADTNQIEDYNRVKQYCTDNNLTLQGYIKKLIQDDLDSKGYK